MSAAPSIARISQLFRDGDHAAVVDACDLALGQGGDASKLAHYKANALVSAGRIREALSFLTSIAAQQQHQRSLVPVHAYCLYKTNRLGDARALIREHKAKSADEANAVDLKLLYLEAQVAYRMGDYEEALGIYRKLLSTVKEVRANVQRVTSSLCLYS